MRFRNMLRLGLLPRGPHKFTQYTVRPERITRVHGADACAVLPCLSLGRRFCSPVEDHINDPESVLPKLLRQASGIVYQKTDLVVNRVE